MTEEKKESFLIARIPKTLKKKVVDEAKKQNKNISQFLRKLLEKALK